MHTETVAQQTMGTMADLDVLLRRRKKLAEKMIDPKLSENTRASARWFYDANEREIAVQYGSGHFL